MSSSPSCSISFRLGQADETPTEPKRRPLLWKSSVPPVSMQPAIIPRHGKTALALVLAFHLGATPCLAPSAEPDHDGSLKRAPVMVNVRESLDRLLADEDTDGDKRITVHDAPEPGSTRGDKRFWLQATDGKRYEVDRTYYLSNLLQELGWKERAGLDVAPIDFELVFEKPVHRISRLIRTFYWNSLTRRIDAEGMELLLRDEKVTPDGLRSLYVPQSDPEAVRYYTALAERHPEWRLRVVPLTPPTHDSAPRLEGGHGLLSLALERKPDGSYTGVPFIVPGGRFNELYGWDSYFEILGLLEDRRLDLAQALVENLLYEVAHYGKILNGNRSYYLTRSQPPLLTSMGLAIYHHLPKNEQARLWLARVIRAAIKEYYTVWMSPPRLTETGLSRYYGEGLGPPPEVEPGHFDAIYRPYAEARHMDLRTFEAQYKAGALSIPSLDRFFVHDRCMRESGHDTTYRWEVNGDRCADFVTVDLNSLLYKTECDIARTIETELGGTLTLEDGSEETGAVWHARADKRKELINRLLWDAEAGMFFDYDVAQGRRHAYVSATTLYPLWAKLATAEQAEAVVRHALPVLEMPGGLAASSEQSRGPLSEQRPARQWDYPYGWAPHQMLAWSGLSQYGYDDAAQRLSYRWLYTITRNAVDYNGTVPEKLDVVRRSTDVFAEYGNVGTVFEHMPAEGFGWMNASYQVGLTYLSPDLRERLNALVPPEWLFE